MASMVKDENAEAHIEQYKTLLYLDALNYTTYFIPLHDWSCTRALARMDEFVQAARRSGIKLRAFIDESTNSDEASEKWRSRREKEVKTGTRMVPQGATVLMGDMLKMCGVEVCYSMEADNDDTLAFHAHADGASILSNDKDFFRYIGATYTVYSSFVVRNGQLHLTKHHLHKPGSSTKREPSKRPIGSPPAVQTEVHHIQNRVYLRGAPSPLVRELGFNPHGVVAPLRHTMYSILHYSGPITEEWPEWNGVENKVRWVVHTGIYPPATPDPVLLELLHNPDAAVTRFFPNEVSTPVYPPRRSIRKDDWQKHVFCVRSVVYELCVMAHRTGPTLLDLWLQFERQCSQPVGRFESQRGATGNRNAATAGGRGRGGRGRGARTESDRTNTIAPDHMQSVNVSTDVNRNEMHNTVSAGEEQNGVANSHRSSRQTNSQRWSRRAAPAPAIINAADGDAALNDAFNRLELKSMKPVPYRPPSQRRQQAAEQKELDGKR